MHANEKNKKTLSWDYCKGTFLIIKSSLDLYESDEKIFATLPVEKMHANEKKTLSCDFRKKLLSLRTLIITPV
ncbi:hypothetical protein TNIN_114151 [Trichonephila inaurata madagascariensis]|uniref:Uncharacterized protein n=1 Tax=Trichonephila inaurata madagascariensis TaxID=2747483 RepID=A0A8X6YC09_9ARAC|nr:hypothetical protein TNIN_114151 [Trichonephila inaurata madagascariensis]